jgi:hypothetical protein
MFFEVLEKSGFITTDKRIEVFDAFMKPFFIENNNKKIFYFNLPKGKYFSKNNLKKASEPRLYSLQNLPDANDFKRLPKTFKIFYIENPNKCTVDVERNIIYFDYSFRDKPEPFLVYIKLHELGHYFYSGEENKSEIFCDWFAYNQMINLGYNPTQIYKAILLTLSDRPDAQIRKNFIKQLSKQI